MELAIGQQWRTRKGGVVTVTERNDHKVYPWVVQRGDSYYSVTADGREMTGRESNGDLIDRLQVVTVKPSLTLALGQQWRTRGGEVVVIDKYEPGMKMCWKVVDDNGLTWNVDDGGTCDTDAPSQDDLIEQIVLPDANALAAETLTALGWRFDGQCWVQDQVTSTNELQSHPLYRVFCDAIEQAMYGKGERHGGARTPFLEQPWRHYAAMHGRGFLTGQAAKKLEEAASTRSGPAFDTECLGALVYTGMAILKERGQA